MRNKTRNNAELLKSNVTFSRLCFLATFLAFIVVVLGAYTRLSDAGLGCPDWPGCYGQVTPPSAEVARTTHPDTPLDAGKAWKEMIHRYFAGALGLIILILAFLALKNRRNPDQMVVLPIILLGLVIFQALLGMWTVTLLLNPLVVMAHLLGGLATFGLLAWLVLRQGKMWITSNDVKKHSLQQWAGLGLIILILQIALGGWTSANYAALACPDFPTCQNSWWPSMSFTGAFSFWRDWGSNFEGGLMTNEARTAIHMMHRLGAVITFLFLMYLGHKCLKKGMGKPVKVVGIILLAVLLAQVVLGISTVILIRPLDVATAHNAVAALLLLTLIALIHLVKPQKSM